jgi:CTP synthase
MSKVKPKYIFVVGGVMSSVGKGVASASVGKILQSKGYKVANIKADMYVNVDAGTIRPAEHGEVFVGEDGIEADQDLGNYERFTDQVCTRDNYMTWGSVNLAVIQKERNLEYKGEDVEVVPDIPNEIIRQIKACGRKNQADIVITEFGGTVGEYQILLFLEAARMMKAQDPDNVFYILVTYLPTPGLLGEQKSKPSQYAIRTLNSAGINPDFILGRSDKPLKESIKNTISVVCSLPKKRIVSAPDVDSIYDVPINLEKENFGNTLLEVMNLKAKTTDMKDLRRLAQKRKRFKKSVKIGIVGKYFNFKSIIDTYISVIESLKFAAWANNTNLELGWLDSEKFEHDKKSIQQLTEYDGILIPGGFGARGTEGKILAAKYARENKLPFLGLCLGLQIMTIEFARNVLKLKGATSEEFNQKAKHPVIHTMEDQKQKIADSNYGATMRLGAYKCKLTRGTKTQKTYQSLDWVKEKGSQIISERHRHRYEVNNKYRDMLEKKGLKVAGINPKLDLIEILEVKDHPFMIGTQFHPEFKSRPLKPHPLFFEFIKTALKKK